MQDTSADKGCGQTSHFVCMWFRLTKWEVKYQTHFPPRLPITSGNECLHSRHSLPPMCTWFDICTPWPLGTWLNWHIPLFLAIQIAAATAAALGMVCKVPSFVDTYSLPGSAAEMGAEGMPRR